MTESFWDFPHSSKIDVLVEKRHSHIIHNALRDEWTCIEPMNRDWIIFGGGDGLLIEPSSFYLHTLLFMYYKLTGLFG